MKNLMNGLKKQYQVNKEYMNKIQEASGHSGFIDDLGVINEAIENFFKTYKNVADKKKLNENTSKTKAQQFSALSGLDKKLTEIATKKPDWKYQIKKINENKTKFHVTYSDYTNEKTLSTDLNFNIKTAINEIKKQFPALVTECKKYDYVVDGFPQRGNNNYSVEFEIEVYKK